MDGSAMTSPDGLAAAYAGRRGVAAQWRGFLRALLETLDAHLEPAARDGLLRAIGGRMAVLNPLPPCATLLEFESRVNDALAAADWGYCAYALDPAARALLITHNAAPLVAAGADVAGAWIGPVLEGLHAGWISAQPGAEASLAARVESFTPGAVALRLGRA